MPLLRLLLAGLVALFAMMAVIFTAAVVLFTGLVGWVLRFFRGPQPAPRPAPRPAAPRAGEEIIEVETTKVPDDPPTAR